MQKAVPFLSIVTLISVLLVIVIALTYGYDPLYLAASAVGVLILLAVAVLLSVYSKRPAGPHTRVLDSGIALGLGLGFLWMIEININNLLAPPLPARDVIDDIFWGVIALAMFAMAVRETYRTNCLSNGILLGVGSGLASGILACLTALLMIVVGMSFILRDPLNVAEWVERGPASGAPSMAAYLAYQTLAGAFLHLVVLGAVMGALLGVLGAMLGKTARQMTRLMRRAA